MKLQNTNKTTKELKDKLVTVRFTPSDYERIINSIGQFTKMTSFVRHIVMSHISQIEKSKGAA